MVLTGIFAKLAAKVWFFKTDGGVVCVSVPMLSSGGGECGREIMYCSGEQQFEFSFWIGVTQVRNSLSQPF